MSRNAGHGPKYGMYLAVLPRYRRPVVEHLQSELKNDLVLFTGTAHLEQSVRTDLPQGSYRPVRNVAIFRRTLLLQIGQWRSAAAVTDLIVDLNARSLTAWILLISRRILRRRTLVWGHLNSQSTGKSPAPYLRRLMRRVADGTVLYDFASVESAQRSAPGRPIWVAPNALYACSDIHSVPYAPDPVIIYVGRLEPDKRVDRLIAEYAVSGVVEQGVRLRLIGSGSALENLRAQAADLGITDSVEFVGEVGDPEVLRDEYAHAVVSVSPGFVGLQLTQSLGFGVEILVPRGERHSPEIELAGYGGVEFFATVPGDLGARLSRRCQDLAVRRPDIAEHVGRIYSAERMAEGLTRALRATDPEGSTDAV